jgi:hypothetical protein
LGALTSPRQLEVSPGDLALPAAPVETRSLGWWVALSVFVWISVEWIVINWARI